jgi:ATP-dependent DNA helicase RecQ
MPANQQGITPEAALKRHFGYDAFRPNQAEIVHAIMAGRDVLAVMPTGAGKSVCYQVPAVCLGGYALVVSPLISLMKDQVNSLEQAGIAAAFVNSSISPLAQRDTLKAVEAGLVRLLYIAPERLSRDDFRAFCAQCPPALVAIDEAHCISQWGQDFRPDYQHISSFVEELPTRPVVAAFTATATRQVRDDIRESLQLRDPLQITASFDRPNLHFSVKRPTGSSGPKSKDGMLRKIVEEHEGQVGIVYCMSRKAVEEVCDTLNSWGYSATRYHAGLGDRERRANQEAFVYDRAQIMVATNAFGMGIDKSNVNFIVHYNISLDLESYYQEAGRAGRDGEPADCILLYAPKDVRTAEFLINAGYGEQPGIDAPTRAELLKRAKRRLKMMTFYATTQDCLRRFILNYFDEEAPGYCGSCGNCETEFEERDVTVEAQKIISCVYRLQQRNRTVGKSTIVDILRGSKAQRMTLGGFDTLSTYGIMRDEGTRHIRFILDALVERGILAQVDIRDGKFQVVQATPQSAEFLRSHQSFSLKVPKENDLDRDRKRMREGRPGPVGTPRNRGYAEAPANPELFRKLKELRADIAAEAGIPAYVVFSNHTLHDMCRRMPHDEAELLEVSGVGQVKADRYGADFLEVINAARE